jgi:heavy metal sensor kinase
VSLSIRARLTLWYSAVLALVLAATLAVFYLVHARHLRERFDAELVRSASLVARLVPEELDEGSDLEGAAGEALEDIVMPGRMLAILDAEGRVLAGSWPGPPAVAERELRIDGLTTTVSAADGIVRRHQQRFRHGDTTYQVGASESLASLDHELAGVRRALLSIGLVALLLAAGGGFWIARGALRPVALLAIQAQSITARTPGQRLAPPNPRDELGALALSFNDLLARLEGVLSQQRQFMADASHELRTPVSVARTALEVTLGQPARPESEYRESLGIVAEQMRRLSRIVDDMFTLARSDAGGLPIAPRPLYLDELVADCVRSARLLGDPKGVAVECRGPEDVELSADETRLRQALMNLLDNAIRHTPRGGHVSVAVERLPDTLSVAVTDGGPGIPPADAGRVFQRFVRLSPTRRDGEGAGLGLPIARTIVEAHGGTLVLAQSGPSGSTFVVHLPQPASASQV